MTSELFWTRLVGFYRPINKTPVIGITITSFRKLCVHVNIGNRNGYAAKKIRTFFPHSVRCSFSPNIRYNWIIFLFKRAFAALNRLRTGIVWRINGIIDVWRMRGVELIRTKKINGNSILIVRKQQSSTSAAWVVSIGGARGDGFNANQMKFLAL